jgi:putative transposase
LNVLGDFNPEGLCIDVYFSRPAERVVRSLNQTIKLHGKPNAIRVNNGTEYISRTLMAWVEKYDVQLERVQPQQKEYIESYKRIVRV